MSANDHEAAAGAEEAAAAAPRCDAAARPCWTDDARSTESRRAEVARHRVAADAHRAAAPALRDVEARDCAGIADADRDRSPFAHREDILSVTDLTMMVTTDELGGEPRLLGVRILLGPVPGLTVEWLERVIACHIARNAVLGHDVPEMEYCPLVPRGVSATVRATDAGFAVDVRADTDTAIAEVVRRARALLLP